MIAKKYFTKFVCVTFIFMQSIVHYIVNINGHAEYHSVLNGNDIAPSGMRLMNRMAFANTATMVPDEYRQDEHESDGISSTPTTSLDDGTTQKKAKSSGKKTDGPATSYLWSTLFGSADNGGKVSGADDDVGEKNGIIEWKKKNAKLENAVWEGGPTCEGLARYAYAKPTMDFSCSSRDRKLPDRSAMDAVMDSQMDTMCLDGENGTLISKCLIDLY